MHVCPASCLYRKWSLRCHRCSCPPKRQSTNSDYSRLQALHDNKQALIAVHVIVYHVFRGIINHISRQIIPIISDRISNSSSIVPGEGTAVKITIPKTESDTHISLHIIFKMNPKTSYYAKPLHLHIFISFMPVRFWADWQQLVPEPLVHM